uniref:HTH myb-type domain-containing protein n=1 Tax=Leersia perrieri TaxID=77586 RepID=A0A0D9XKD0_9ORYZ
MSFISGNLPGLDLIISDVFFPTEDGLLILQEVTTKFGIPTVIMASSADASTVMKYVANGAADFLLKPVRIEELRNIWQHVFRKQMREHNNNNIMVGNNLERSYPPPPIAMAPAATTRTAAEASTPQEISEVRDINSNNGEITDIRDLRKSRLSWTAQLHRQFIAAVNHLGEDKAVPKKILGIMKVKHLTREQVASHLQKYRLHLKKSIPSTSRDGTTLPSTALNTQNHPSRSKYFDQDVCMEITDYSLPKDDLSSGSECKLEEQNDYSLEDFQDFRWDSDKQEYGPCFWNF